MRAVVVAMLAFTLTACTPHAPTADVEQIHEPPTLTAVEGTPPAEPSAILIERAVLEAAHTALCKDVSRPHDALVLRSANPFAVIEPAFAKFLYDSEDPDDLVRRRLENWSPALAPVFIDAFFEANIERGDHPQELVEAWDDVHWVTQSELDALKQGMTDKVDQATRDAHREFRGRTLHFSRPGYGVLEEVALVFVVANIAGLVYVVRRVGDLWSVHSSHMLWIS